MVVKSYSAKDTGKFATNLAKKFLKKGGIIGLIGELGSGKTIFAQGFAKGLGIKEKIVSPTFVLMRKHVIPPIVIPVSKTHPESSNPHDSGRTSFARMTEEGSNRNKIFYHLDLYRLESKKDFDQLGLEEIFTDENAVILIEWADKILDKLPKKTLKITFEKTSDESRKILVEKV